MFWAEGVAFEIEQREAAAGLVIRRLSRVRLHDAHQDPGHGGLAASALADEPRTLAAAAVEAHPVEGADRRNGRRAEPSGLPDRVDLGQIAHRQQWLVCRGGRRFAVRVVLCLIARRGQQLVRRGRPRAGPPGACVPLRGTLHRADGGQELVRSRPILGAARMSAFRYGWRGSE